MKKNTNRSARLIGDRVVTSSKTYSVSSYKHMRTYQDDYERKRYRRFNVRMRYNEDKDIISFLESQDNLYEYLRNVIRSDIERQQLSDLLKSI